MSDATITLTEDEAEAIMWPAGGAATSYTGDEHRWHIDRWYVFERDGKLYEFLYMAPATEMQDGQDVWEDDPIPCYEVVLGYRMVPEYRRV